MLEAMLAALAKVIGPIGATGKVNGMSALNGAFVGVGVGVGVELCVGVGLGDQTRHTFFPDS